jgi:exopolyphosphatase/guanosine-5'-triphosphate,3'-diphosphate pyrophosphatase
MQRQSIVDLGSNTARLVVFEYEPGAWYWLRDSIREPIRLGEGLATTGRISPAATERAVAALHLFADFAEASGLEPPHVICTSAVREASNGQEVLRHLEALGMPFEVLPGEEESRLGVLAVANGFALEDAWVVDLGGGSAQVGELRGRQFRRGSSHPLGAVRLTEAHLPSDPPSGSEIEALETFVETTVGDWIELMRRDTAPIVAMGGSIRNLARAVQVELDYPLDLIHAYELPRKPFERLVDELLAMSISERTRRFDINPDRADILAAAAVVFRLLFRQSGRETVLISGQGVREGAFFRHFLPAPHLISDVTRFGVRNLATHYGQTEPHVARVRRIARRLFRILAPLHGLGDRDRVLLDAAATLHDIGMTVGYHRHHKHGAYLAMNRPLSGFDHREQALIALMIRYHRKGSPSLSPYGSIMQDDDKTRLRQLTTCLRLAEQLERSRTGRIEELSAAIGGEKVVLTAHAREQPVVEIWEARKHADLFESAFGLGLRIESRLDPEGP